jgi:hypothetical protein
MAKDKSSKKAEMKKIDYAALAKELVRKILTR